LPLPLVPLPLWLVSALQVSVLLLPVPLRLRLQVPLLQPLSVLALLVLSLWLRLLVPLLALVLRLPLWRVFLLLLHQRPPPRAMFCPVQGAAEGRTVALAQSDLGFWMCDRRQALWRYRSTYWVSQRLPTHCLQSGDSGPARGHNKTSE